MMRKKLLLLAVCSASVIAAQAIPAANPINAAPVQIPIIADPTTITEMYRLAIGNWATAATRDLNALFGVLALLELSWTGMTLLFDRHSLDSAISLMMRKMLAISFFAMLMANAGTWMPMIINAFVALGKTASGINSLAPSEIFKTGANIAGRLLWSAASSGVHLDILTAFSFLFAAIVIFLCFILVTINLIVCLLQTYFAIGIGVYFTWLGASRWTINYVERYFSYTVAAGIQLMTMYLVAGTGLVLAQGWLTLSSNTAATMGGTITGWIIAGSAIIYAFICWFLPKQAAALIGGAPNLSHGDALAFSVPLLGAGAAIGGAAATALTAGAASPSIVAVSAPAAVASSVSAAGSAASAASPGPQVSNGHTGSGGASPGPNIGSAALGAMRGMPNPGSPINPPHSGIGH
jgi:type IV secretion system protein TrbL